MIRYDVRHNNRRGFIAVINMALVSVHFVKTTSAFFILHVFLETLLMTLPASAAENANSSIRPGKYNMSAWQQARQ